MRPLVAVLACWLVPLEAAMVRGVILDNSSGRPLARTLVRLDAVQGSTVNGAATRTASSGQFSLTSLKPGLYVLSASRNGFLTLRYGQKRWNAPARPILLGEETDLFLELRMSRLGAITGTVTDENDIGLPDQQVVAYTATRPPKIVGSAKADETGYYRIGRLSPGRYLIRSLHRELEDGSGLLPTFHKEVLAVAETQPVLASLDETVRDVNVRPVPGKLYRFAGRIGGAPPNTPLAVTLISDTGRLTRATDASGAFSFERLPPGEYELIAHNANPPYEVAFYTRFFHNRDEENAYYTVLPLPDVFFQLGADGKRVDPKLIGIYVRRKDLAGEGQPELIPANRATLLPGRWEILISTPPDLYPKELFARHVTTHRPDAWTEFRLPNQGREGVQIDSSTHPATFAGKVVHGSDPAAAAPVYLEPLNPETGKRLAALRSAVTNVHGEFRFAGLAPGPYRILSTFEFDDPDEEAMETAHAKTVTLSEDEEHTEKVDLYTEP